MEFFVLRDVDDNYAPASKPVLRISMIGHDMVSLQIGELDEGPKGWALKQIAQIVVDAEPLFAGLNAATVSRRIKDA